MRQWRRAFVPLFVLGAETEMTAVNQERQPHGMFVPAQLT
jgi:hypothetical protein